jgi:hypothetical protein
LGPTLARFQKVLSMFLLSSTAKARRQGRSVPLKLKREEFRIMVFNPSKDVDLWLFSTHLRLFSSHGRMS